MTIGGHFVPANRAVASKTARFICRWQRFAAFPLKTPTTSVETLVKLPTAAGISEFSPRACRGENDFNFLICHWRINRGKPAVFHWLPFLFPLFRRFAGRVKGLKMYIWGLTFVDCLNIISDAFQRQQVA